MGATLAPWVSNINFAGVDMTGAAGSGILGNVQEREVAAPTLFLQTASDRPFPKATHRKQSKVCLALSGL